MIRDSQNRPQRPHILALCTSSPHPSSVSSFGACGASCCQPVKLRKVHCGCADLQLCPGLGHGTSWVIPTRDPILLRILLSNSPPNLQASESPPALRDAQMILSLFHHPVSLHPLWTPCLIFFKPTYRLTVTTLPSLTSSPANAEPPIFRYRISFLPKLPPIKCETSRFKLTCKNSHGRPSSAASFM